MTEKNILFVGSPPPPYHGQAVITGIVFETEFSSIDPTFYEARFSEELSAVGGVSLKKVGVLLRTWGTMLTYALLHKRPELYYCAGSAHTVPFLRDVLLLNTVGKLFKKRYIHYHSGGLPAWLADKAWRKVLGNWCYGGRSVSIACSRFVEVPIGDGNVQELPNGLEVPGLSRIKPEDGRFRFLYVGALRETKGVKVLLEAAEKLAGQNFEVSIVGEWVSNEEKLRCLAGVSDEFIEQHVRFRGRLTGEDKWEAFRESDTFVFPTFYESENMPLVVIEALGSGLPVISTHWRGIPRLIQDGVTGFLVEPENKAALTEKLAWCMRNTKRLDVMRDSARKAYESSYSVEAFQENLRMILGDAGIG